MPPSRHTGQPLLDQGRTLVTQPAAELSAAPAAVARRNTSIASRSPTSLLVRRD